MYLALCIAAVIFAMHAPADQRRAASVVAWALLGTWFVCGLPYQGPGFAQSHYIDIWTVADTAFGLFAIWQGHRHWWGWALLGSTMAQVTLHGFNSVISAAHYLDALDGLLRAQIAVFILIGGKGVADRLYRAADRSWHVFRASGSAFQKHRP
jgi:hypothetical protein